jgi:flagellar hook protein FlgE
MKKFLMLATASSLALYMTACSDNSTSADDDPLKPASIYVMGTDYNSSGELRWLNEDGVSEKSLQFFKDSKAIGIDGNLFILERKGADNIALVDPSENKVTWQVELDDNSNPSDVVKANKDEVWVSLDDAAKIIKVSVKDGKVTKTIKTDDFSQGEEKTPHLIDLDVSGDTLFALFQRGVSKGFNREYPAPALLALYKLNDGELLDTIQLAKKNPMGMGFANGKLYVASHGLYNTSYGTDADDARGIEVVDFAKKSSSMVIDGKKLGGGVFTFAIDPDGVIYAAINNGYDENYVGNIPLVKVDLSKKSVESIDGLSDVEGSLIFDDVDGVLYIGDRGPKTGGLYSYDNGKLKKIDAPKDMLPVYNIAIVR